MHISCLKTKNMKLKTLKSIFTFNRFAEIKSRNRVEYVKYVKYLILFKIFIYIKYLYIYIFMYIILKYIKYLII